MLASNQNTTPGQPDQTSKTGSKISRNDNIIFIICFVIAGLFWGLIKLSEVYTEDFVFKINYINVPAEKLLTKMVDSTLVVNIEAQGFAILKLNFIEGNDKIDIDLDNCDVIKNEGSDYLIYTQELKEVFAAIFGVEENDFSFSETTLEFTLEDLQEKQLVVKENYKLDFKPQYDLYQPSVITPKMITVYGPGEILDTLSFVLVQKIRLNNLDENKSVSVGLENPLPTLLHFKPDIVTMDIRVEKFTEKSVDVPIDFSSIKQEIKSFPNSAQVNFKIAQKDFNLATANQFQIVPETEGLNIRTADKLQLKLAKKPDFIRNEWIVPTEVEFLIIK